MNYLDKQLLAQLSQRYVTGVMPYLTRRRFQDLIANHQAVQDAVLAWEQYFMPLALAVAPVKPSDLVWRRILNTVNATSQHKAKSASFSSRPVMAGISALMFAGLVVTSAGWWQTAHQTPERIVETVVEVIEKPVPESAIISVMGQPAPPVWIIKIYPQSKHLTVAVNNLPQVEPQKDYQLWALKNDKTPVSLGILPKTGKAELKLDDAMLASIQQSSLLAVSLEPLGGSPENVPTGPVIHTAQLLFN